MDLREASRDSPRRLLALVGGLPLEAATFRGDLSGWTQSDEFAATTIEVIDAWGRQIVAAVIAAAGGKTRMGDPIRIEHPDRPKPEKPEKPKVTSDPAEIAAFFHRRVRG